MILETAVDRYDCHASQCVIGIVVAHSIPREFLRLIRAGHAGFVHRQYGCL